MLVFWSFAFLLRLSVALVRRAAALLVAFVYFLCALKAASLLPLGLVKRLVPKRGFPKGRSDHATTGTATKALNCEARK